ncbi:MAG TPA: mechanosensitive ion channel family protein [Acidimicrobiales bacterium]|nr:mechanosensitive ion channel family protein [Acidimicrobiales bacterium]
MPHRTPVKGINRPGNWAVASFLGALAVAAAIVGRAYGRTTGHDMNPKLIAWVGAGVLLVAGIISVTRLSKLLSHLATKGSPAAGGAVRIVSAGAGYLVVLFAVLAVLEVQTERLLVGAGVVGVVLGIAAQQSLGNVFAGLVLLLARPFEVGDRIRVRSGSLGGIFEAQVTEMSLTYVSLVIDEAPLKIPNSVMLAAGVGRLPPLPAAEVAAAVNPALNAAATDGASAPQTIAAGTPSSRASTVGGSVPPSSANDPSAPPGEGPQ